jgi:hypothetical protein
VSSSLPPLRYFVSLLVLPLLLIYFVAGGLFPAVAFKKNSKHHKRPSVMPSLVVIHPFQLPAGWNLTRLNNTCNHIFKAMLSILILRKT